MRQLFIIALLLSGCASVPCTTTQVTALSPLPNAQGKIIQTGEPTDLAIDGDGFFVLSREQSPKEPEDLVFTRDGYFHFEFSPGSVAGTGTYALVNRDGLFVMAYHTTVEPSSRPFGTPPEESIDTLVTQVVGDPVIEVLPTALQFDLAHNPDAPNNCAFDSQGMLRIAGDAPHDAEDHDLNLHVVLAAFPFPQYLQPLERGDFAYSPAAGRLILGTAANSGANREVGTNNVIVSGAMERR